MKELKNLFYLLAFVLAFAACSSDDGDGEGGSEEVNVNKNTVTTEAAVTRLEFPKLKGGNSVVIVHHVNNTTFDKDGVNYSVEWDCDKKSQRWSCYILTSTNKKKNVSRYYGNPQYPNDPELQTGQYWDTDYIYNSYYGTSKNENTSFDHGHIVPSNDRLYSSEINYQTFYLTNMQPQYKVFNGSHSAHEYKGLWINMENFVYGLKLSSTDTLYICKGGTIDKDDQILTKINDKLIVPKYFFAALLLKNSLGYRALGFWFPHTNEYHGDDSLADYAVTIDKLEELTGIDFFCNLPDDVENKVERSIATNAWGIK